MKYYFYKLLPPRPTFPADMTEAEMGVMMRHGAYWREHLQGGRAIAVGPVADPAGAYGVGIVVLDDATDPKTLAEHDPAIMANLGFRAEIFPMPRLIARGVDQFLSTDRRSFVARRTPSLVRAAIPGVQLLRHLGGWHAKRDPQGWTTE